MSDAAPVSDHKDYRRIAETYRMRLRSVRKRLGVDSIDEIDDRVHKLVEEAEAGRAAAKERDTLKQQLSTPDEKDSKIKDLSGQIRTRDHKDAFRAAAISKGVDPKNIDDLYTVSGLKAPDDGEIKGEDFAAFFDEAKTAKPWAFAAESRSAEQTGHGGATLNGATTQPPPGAGRSASAPLVSQVRISRTEYSKPGWQKAHPEYVEALGKGNAVFVE